MSEASAAGTMLLRYLDARVRRDRAMPGFAGRVVVAVRGLRGPRFWIADFGADAKTAFSDEKPPSYSVAVGLDDAGARVLLGLPTSGAPQQPQQIVAGDPKLLRRFVERYLRDVSPLQSRLGAMTMSQTSKPRGGA